MASLREVKSQIHSVKSTQQITSAMQMVSTVKLQRAQRIVERFFPYQQKINELLMNFLNMEEDGEEKTQSVFEEKREVKKIAIVAFTSNMSLCGSFNANVIKEFIATINQYEHLGKENILIYAVGRKIAQAVKRLGFTAKGVYEDLANKPNYEDTTKIANELMDLFEKEQIDEVFVIYHHFKSKGSQILARKSILPLSLKTDEVEESSSYIKYIVEPDKETILSELIPIVIRLTVYNALLESHTSEHAARSIAMQSATDNADDMLEDLSLLYNKSRQASITNELLDIIGASFK